MTFAIVSYEQATLELPRNWLLQPTEGVRIIYLPSLITTYVSVLSLKARVCVCLHYYFSFQRVNKSELSSINFV